MIKPNLILIGGSLGSIEALEIILKDLKNIEKTTIVCLIHRLKNAKNQLGNIFTNFNPNLIVCEIEDKMIIDKNHFYICPSNYHVLINNDNYFSLDYSEPVNYSRPSIDVLFESAAENYKGRILTLLLSGSNKDGMIGIKELFKKKHTVIVQNPNSCLNPVMTGSVIENNTFTESLTPMEIKEFLFKILNTN